MKIYALLHLWYPVYLFFSILLLAGCGNQVQESPLKKTANCEQLRGVKIAADQIGMPSNGAVVNQADLLVSNPADANGALSYCKLIGQILPIDVNAPNIQFQLNLPLAWNQKTMMFGGGGYNGELFAFPSGLGNLLVAAASHASPLARGYATYGSDSGHTLQPPFTFGRDASFASNDEALDNYLGDALKKTHDVAQYLVQMYYQEPARKAYFHGGSTGGREALTVIQRWPQDFDGAIALFPSWNASSMTLQMGRITRAMAAPGAYLNVAKRKLLLSSSIANCDLLDNVKDGIISNIHACDTIFDPATASRDGSANGLPLRCAGGADLGDDCLSDAQIAMLKIYATPITFPQNASGEKEYPGFHLWGADLGIPANNPELALIEVTGLNRAQPAFPLTTEMPYLSIYYDQWVKYFITRDASFNSLQLDPEHPGQWHSRISEISRKQDSNQTDLSAFAQKGGKLLLLHGLADALVSTQASARYYQGLQQRMGLAQVKSFVRYWEVPGYGHGVSPVFNASFDALTPLENWAERDIAPDNLQVVDKTGVPGRSRPLCHYPTWPKYRGSGDIHQASSFDCVPPP